MANLSWIRDCWTLFVANLSRNVTKEDLFRHFREAGFVFDVFIPKNKMYGSSRVFAFVCYKTE